MFLIWRLCNPDYLNSHALTTNVIVPLMLIVAVALPSKPSIPEMGFLITSFLTDVWLVIVKIVPNLWQRLEVLSLILRWPLSSTPPDPSNRTKIPFLI